MLETEKKEAAIMSDILENGTYIRPWVKEKLKEINCEIVNGNQGGE